MICVLPVCEAFADNLPGQYKALFLKFPCSPLCKIYLFSTMICLSSRRNTLTHHKALWWCKNSRGKQVQKQLRQTLSSLLLSERVDNTRTSAVA